MPSARSGAIDRALERVKFAKRIACHIFSLDGDRTLAFSVRRAVEKNRRIAFDQETSNGELVQRLVREGLQQHDDNHIRVGEILERLVKKNQTIATREQALTDLLEVEAQPTQASDGADKQNLPLAIGHSTVRGSSFPKMAPGAKRRGHAIVVNVEKFDDASKHRKGSRMDVDKVERLLKWLHFEVIVGHNVQGSILEWIRARLSELEFTDNDWFVCFLMSHGEGEYLLSSNDEPVKLDDVFQLACNPTVSRVLAENKLPKLFFVEACRRPLANISGSVSNSFKHSHPPENFLCMYATRSGESAFRYEDHGSVFINWLDRCLREHVPEGNIPLVNILMSVIDRCQEEPVKIHEGEDTDEANYCRQVPSIQIEIGKQMYLNGPNVH